MKTFEHVASEIGAEEAEEVGVEHLLRLGIFIINSTGIIRHIYSMLLS